MKRIAWLAFFIPSVLFGASYTKPTTENAPPATQIWGYDQKNGYYRPMIFNAEYPAVMNQPYLFAIAEGDIVGHSNFFKIGRNPDVQNTSEDLWEVGGTYLFPPDAGEQMTIASTDANDISGGTGARTVTISYLNSSFAEATETLVLNGTGTVNTVATNIARVNGCIVATAGSAGAAVGTIDVYQVGVSTRIYTRISPGLTACRQMIYTVPAGKTLYITSARISAGVGNTTASGKYNFVIFTTRGKINPITGAVSTLFYPTNEIGIVNATFDLTLDVPSVIPATADIKMTVVGDTAQAVTCTGSIRGWIE